MKRGMLLAALLAPFAALAQEGFVEPAWSPPPLIEAEPGPAVPSAGVPAALPAVPSIVFPEEAPAAPVTLGWRSGAGSVLVEGLLGGVGAAGLGLGGALVGCVFDQGSTLCLGGALLGLVAGG